MPKGATLAEGRSGTLSCNQAQSWVTAGQKNGCRWGSAGQRNGCRWDLQVREMDVVGTLQVREMDVVGICRSDKWMSLGSAGQINGCPDHHVHCRSEKWMSRSPCVLQDREMDVQIIMCTAGQKNGCPEPQPWSEKCLST